jgi:putative colanic acid biosynthesis acetyltransferase WcaF
MKKVLWYITNCIFFKSSLPGYWFKPILLRIYGAKAGNSILIKPNVNIKYPWNLEIGDNVWIGENVWIDNLDKVKIGNNVCLSQGALLLCGNHDYKKSTFDLITGPIRIEDGAWICAKATVTQNVTCQSHSILGVNSLANKDLEAYTIYSGIPAKPIRRRIIE